MESKRRNFRCLSVIVGLAIAVFATTGQGQPLNATFTSKSFSPAAIPLGGRSILTISITNPTGARINNVTFTDTVPAGVTALEWMQALGCLGQLYGSTPTTVFATLDIAAGATCAVSYFVTSNVAGTYTNSTANITNWNGSVLAFRAASLVAGPIPPVPTPTLSGLSLVLLALGVAAVAYRDRFRRARSSRED